MSPRPTAIAGREDQLLAALSHELRTPLNGVLGMAGLLARTRLDAAQRSYLTALQESGEHLLGLVNDVLDLAKLDSGGFDLNPAPMDVEELLQSVAELLSPRAHAKGLEIAWAASRRVRARSPAMPSTPFRGVRSSWLRAASNWSSRPAMAVGLGLMGQG